MKITHRSNGQFAASSRSGAPHTPRSLGQKPPAITDSGTRVKVSGASNRESHNGIDKRATTQRDYKGR